MMFQNIKRQSDQDFQANIAAVIQNAKMLWGTIAGLAVQAILHYYENGHDVSRCEQLYTALGDSGLGSHQTAFSAVLRKCTGISGIGGDKDWKGKGNSVPRDEIWQPIVQALIDGEGAALMSYKQAPKSKSNKDKADSPPKLSTPSNASKPVINAAQKVLDKVAELPEAQALSALRSLENPDSSDLLSQFENQESRDAATEVLKLLLKEEQALGADDVVGSCKMVVGKIHNWMESRMDVLQKAVSDLKDVA